MKFFKGLAIALLACIVLFFLIGPLLPKTGTFERTYEINAAVDDVAYEIVDLYEQHLWPIWDFQDTTVIFTALIDGYQWENDGSRYGECHYLVADGPVITDQISINGKDIAETAWVFEGSKPTNVTLTFKVHAAGIGARWTNLFLKSLIGNDTDVLIDRVKKNVEP